MRLKYDSLVNVPANILGNKVQEAQNELAHMVLKDSERYVPMRTGELRRSGYVAGDEVIYNTEHASYVYRMHGVNFTTPGTDGEWDKLASERNLSKWAKDLERVFND